MPDPSASGELTPGEAPVTAFGELRAERCGFCDGGRLRRWNHKTNRSEVTDLPCRYCNGTGEQSPIDRTEPTHG